jgi:hypothetical protein
VEPVQTTPVPPSEEADTRKTATVPSPKEETKPERTAVRCKVTLPEIQEVNGVYMYPEPLVCTPVAESEEHKEEKSTGIRSLKLANLETLKRLFSTEDFERIKSLFSVPQSTFAKLEPSAGTPKTLMPALQEAPVQVRTEKPVANNATYTVQVGAYRTETAARKVQEDISSRYNTMSATAIFNIIKADLGSKGVYYRLRITNFLNKKDAKDFCQDLAAHGKPCFLSSQNDLQ